MLAEISVVVGVLKTLNAGIKTVKESGENLTGLAAVFDTLTASKAAVETIESESSDAKDGKVLTQEEALSLAWIRDDIKKKERALKRSVPPQVWRDMLFLQSKSLANHKFKLEQIRLAKLRRITKIDTLFKNVLGAVCVILSAALAYYFLILPQVS